MVTNIAFSTDRGNGSMSVLKVRLMQEDGRPTLVFSKKSLDFVGKALRRYLLKRKGEIPLDPAALKVWLGGLRDIFNLHLDRKGKKLPLFRYMQLELPQVETAEM